MALPYNSATFSEHSFGILTFDEVVNTYSGGNLSKATYKLQDKTIGVVEFTYDSGGNLIKAKRTQ